MLAVIGLFINSVNVGINSCLNVDSDIASVMNSLARIANPGELIYLIQIELPTSIAINQFTIITAIAIDQGLP